MPVTCSGPTLITTRTSPGLFMGYLSWPMYFLASLSIPAAPPSAVISTTRPAIWMYSYGFAAFVTVKATRGSRLRFFTFARFCSLLKMTYFPS